MKVIASRRAPKRKKDNARPSLWRRIKQNREIYLMLIPGLVFLVVVRYIPMYGIKVAFQDFDPFLGLSDSPWVGLKHFIEAFQSDVFWRATKNTIVISFWRTAFSLTTPVIFALLLNQLRMRRFKKVVQTISYFPYFISWVVVGGLAFSFLGSEYGLINNIIRAFGGEGILFYQNGDVWLPIFVITEVWKSMGWGSILYLAALSAVNTDLYEAIEIDGGGRWCKVLNVDLPTLTPVFTVNLILSAGNLFRGNFDQIYALIGDSIVSPNSLLAAKSEILEIFTYRMGILNGSFSFATAVGLFQSVLSAVLIYGTNYLAGRLNDDKRFTLM